jgi:hypothetical protein
MIPYKCGAAHDGKVCGQEASIAFYRERWFYLCSAHADTINAYSSGVQRTLILTYESSDELNWRSLPSGEDR